MNTQSASRRGRTKTGKLIPTLLLSLALTVLVPTESRAARAAPPSVAQAASAELVGTWQATGADQELLEFRADGLLDYDGGSLRYSTRGSRLVLEVEGQEVEGTWRIIEGELTLTLVGPDGESTSERYLRVEPAGSREAVGRASFSLPKGWTIGNRNGELAVVNPGFEETDTLDALIVVGSDTLEGDDLSRTVSGLLEVNLPVLEEYLRQVQVEAELSRAKVTALALPKLAGAQITLSGLSGGQLPVTVWVGTTRDANAAASVLVVVLRGKEDAYLPGARRILESLQFTAEPQRDVNSSAGLAGLTFGHVSFYDSGSSTTTYSFYASGAVTRESITSTSDGFGSETRGSYVLRGDRVTIQVDGSTEEATLERSGGEVTGLRMGNIVYDRY
jgi:hypothetical protein